MLSILFALFNKEITVAFHTTSIYEEGCRMARPKLFWSVGTIKIKIKNADRCKTRHWLEIDSFYQ